MAEEVAVRVDLDLEPGLAHPAGGERVRLVLPGASGDAARARPTADRVQLLQPIEDARGVYSPNGLIGFEPVLTITLFVSR